MGLFYKLWVCFTNFGFVLQTIGLLYKPTVDIQTKCYVYKPIRVTLQTQGLVYKLKICLLTMGFCTNLGLRIQTVGVLYKPVIDFHTMGLDYKLWFGLKIKGLVHKPRLCYTNQVFSLQT